MQRTIRTLIASVSVVALVLPLAVANAQFGGILRRARGATNAAASSDGCATGTSSNAGGRALGNILGGLANDAARRTGVSSWVPSAEFADQLDASIACKLDPEEQKQAADATLEATRGAGADGTGKPAVGQMSAWTSNTRNDVSGTSTVSQVERQGNDGRDCIMVTDVIIVDGEETRANKRMCRIPPAVRYAIVA
jgi:surface antigen